MSFVTLNLPAEARVTGVLCDRSDVHNLTQDMLQVELPGDVFIDVGWYPDWNPDGEYRLFVFYNTVENQLEPPLFTKDVHEIEEAIYSLVSKYLDPVRSLTPQRRKA